MREATNCYHENVYSNRAKRQIKKPFRSSSTFFLFLVQHKVLSAPLRLWVPSWEGCGGPEIKTVVQSSIDAGNLFLTLMLFICGLCATLRVKKRMLDFESRPFFLSNAHLLMLRWVPVCPSFYVIFISRCPFPVDQSRTVS